eukprot:355937_1
MASASAVGMMNPAFAVGRREILEWTNSNLQLNLSKVEETANGCVALQFIDMCHPGTVAMSKIKWEARLEHEYVQNYKVLQNAFEKVGIDKHIPVDKLVRGKYQDNLEWMQWLKWYVETAGATDGYDPLATRSKCKGGRRPSSNQRPTRTEPVQVSGNVPSVGNAQNVKNKNTGGTGVAKTNASSSNALKTKKSSTRMNNSSSGTAAAPSSLSCDKDTEIVSLKAELEKMRVTTEEVSRERMFYFDKLRLVELYLQLKEEQGGDEMGGTKEIFKILYASTEDEIAVSEDGRVLEGEDAVAYNKGETVAVNGVDLTTTEKKEEETAVAVDEVDHTIGEEEHQMANPQKEEVQAY